MTDPTREALRYLGAQDGDEASLALVTEGFAALAHIAPRHQLAAYDVHTVLDAFQSRALAAHLQGCERAVLLAATLGTETDRLIRRVGTTDMLRAAALHACAAAKIEAYCDTIQAGIEDARRPRFSPGYADFALASQHTLLQMTDATRRIGLYLTDSGMLAPAKSITAVLGLGPALPGCPANKCARCDKYDCAYRGENPPCH